MVHRYKKKLTSMVENCNSVCQKHINRGTVAPVSDEDIRIHKEEGHQWYTGPRTAKMIRHSTIHGQRFQLLVQPIEMEKLSSGFGLGSFEGLPLHPHFQEGEIPMAYLESGVGSQHRQNQGQPPRKGVWVHDWQPT